MRELALERAGGNRVDGSKIAAAQSGRAIELMNQGLINLASKLRSSYGDGGLVSILKMFVAIAGRDASKLQWRDGSPVGTIPEEDITLVWPSWHMPTPSDNVETANALATLRGAGLVAQETGIAFIAPVYEVTDINHELTAIAKEKADELAAQTAAAKSLKPPKTEN